MGEAIGDPARTALVVVNLAKWAFHVAVMVKPLQPPQNLLLAAGRQRCNLVGTKKPVAVEALQNLTVTVGQPQWRNLRRTFEAGKSRHPLILT